MHRPERGSDLRPLVMLISSLPSTLGYILLLTLIKFAVFAASLNDAHINFAGWERRGQDKQPSRRLILSYFPNL